MPQSAAGKTPIVTRRERLLAMASASGGWPYYATQPARIEPTCWALLALSGGAAQEDTRASAGARTYLRSLRRTDGLLAEPATPGPNYAWNALALLALNTKDDLNAADRLATGLIAAKGIQLKDSDTPVARQNSQLQAWSWTEGTFSWIEPTAWCLLALKMRRASASAVAARIREAEAVILDRVCDSGGWNYGNSQVLTQDLRPYVPTTALALLAMQDQRDHPVVRKSLDWLTAHATAEKATMALALAAVCLQVYGRRSDEVLRLLEAQDARTHALDNAHLLAMAAYALALPTHRAAAMTLP
jgi:hypothetical protein